VWCVWCVWCVCARAGMCVVCMSTCVYDCNMVMMQTDNDKTKDKVLIH